MSEYSVYQSKSLISYAISGLYQGYDLLVDINKATNH
jgi:hypothetical protein